MLIEQDPDLSLDGVPEGSWTPLMLACRKEHMKTAEVLLGNGANVDRAKEDLVNSLHIASYEGFNEMVRYLTSMKANANVADCFGVTPLMMAIKEGYIETLKTLLWNGKADPNLQEKKVRHSAAFFAVQCKRIDMLDLLLRNDRIDLSIRDLGGNTVMDFAEKHNKEAFLFMQENYKDKFEEHLSKKPPVAVTAARPQQPPLVTQKKLANLVAEMMQGIDVRMGRKQKGEVTASAA